MARPWPRPPARGRLAVAKASAKGRLVAPVKGANYRVPTRGYRPWPALPPVGAMAPAAGVAPNGQGQPSLAQGQRRRRGGKRG
ncbi:hypothetical protein GW17_00061746 [Ensete ventricosum]|nr:hypothetical protein GW17_00061746 [Ensete ventricosum]